MTDYLVTRLLAAIEETEKPEFAKLATGQYPSAAVLRHCAADRELIGSAQEALELVDDNGQVITDSPTHIDPDAYEQIEERAAAWRAVLRNRAEAYDITIEY